MSSTKSAPVTTGVTLSAPAPRWIFFAVFAISGFSGLIYESIWSHYLKLFLGHAAYAQSLVLIIFMGGLAIGSWLVARFAERWRAPLLSYALAEGAIGVVALVFHKTFVAMADTFYVSILPSVDAAWLGTLLKWSAAAALILPQSVLLGTTFPFMSAGLIRRYPDGPGGSLATLYFTNSLGAAVGVLASGFWLIARVGLPGTVMTAGLLNIVLALVVWVLVKLDPSPTAAALAPRAANAGANGTDGLVSLFVAAAAVTGLSSFMYEIGWLRMLSLVLGSTTHSFELMLSAFIGGLAFGGLWIKRRIDHVDAIRYSGWVQVLMGTMAVLTLPVYVRSFDWMAASIGALQPNDSGYGLFTLLSQGIAVAVMVPTTFLAGTTLPLFTHALMRGRDGERAIGRIYAANTLGAIAGVLVAVHVVMPLLGLKPLIGIAAALDVLLGLVLLRRSTAPTRARAVVLGACVGLSALAVVMVGVNLDPRRLASGVYRYGHSELAADSQVLFHRDGKTATITLSTIGSIASLATNGKPDAAIQMDGSRPASVDEITMIMMGAVPLAYARDARYVANIGLGSGLTTNTLLGASSIERVDTVEIEPAMTVAARGFGEHVARTFTDPRSVIHIEDAKAFFAEQKTIYDVIVAEPSNPWVSGVSSLFSEEFYRSVGRYLSEDGVFVQWLQLYEFNDELAQSVLKALTAHFADYAIYSTGNTDLLIVAKRTGRLPPPSFEALFTGPLAADLARVGLKGPEDFLVRRTATKRTLDALLTTTALPANSDYFPFLDLNAGKARFKRETSTLFNYWSVVPVPMLEMLGVADVNFGAVTATDSFMRATLVGKAARDLASLTGGPADAANASAADGTEWLRALRATCGKGYEHSWAEGLDRLAREALPFLEPDAANELLAAAVPPACRNALPPKTIERLDLYSAVAARDGARMAEAGEKLLSGEGPPELKYYALVAAMLGRLAMGERERVMQLYDGHRQVAADLRSSPEIRLMLALAKAPAEIKTTARSQPLL